MRAGCPRIIANTINTAAATALLAKGLPLESSAVVGLSILGLFGVTIFSFGAAPLGRWARTRAEQFRELAGRLLSG